MPFLLDLKVPFILLGVLAITASLTYGIHIIQVGAQAEIKLALEESNNEVLWKHNQDVMDFQRVEDGMLLRLENLDEVLEEEGRIINTQPELTKCSNECDCVIQF